MKGNEKYKQMKTIKTENGYFSVFRNTHFQEATHNHEIIYTFTENIRAQFEQCQI